MTIPRAKMIMHLALGAALGSVVTYGILWVHQTRRQAWLNVYTASWDSYFTTQTIAELRQGNLDKAESLLQSRLNAQIQTIGMTIEDNKQYRSDYLKILDDIKGHRLKYPYRAKSDRINNQADKTLSLAK